MGRTLDEIATDYDDFAEITVLIVEDRQKKRFEILFAVVELLPFEQEASPLLVPGADEQSRCARQRWTEGKRTLYAARARVKRAEALSFFRGDRGVRSLRLSESGSSLELHAHVELQAEPPAEVPVLIGESGLDIYSVLPARRVGVRVCSFVGDGLSRMQQLSEREKRVLSDFGKTTLGVDLVERPEHLGAIHLALPDPILRRRPAERLADGERHLLIEFFERKGKSIVGGTIQFTDHRHTGFAFDRVFPIHSTRMVVEIDCDPSMLESRVRNEHGELIEHSHAAFPRGFSFMVGSGLTRVVAPPLRRKNETPEEVVVTSYEDPSVTVVRPETHSLLALAEYRRRESLAEAREEFWFFDGESDSRNRARKTVRKLVGDAMRRLLLCDPYLCADDVTEYAAFTKTARLEVHLLAAAQTLREPTDREDKTSRTYGQELHERIGVLQSNDKTLRFVCKVLAGDKSRIHDRFLVVDERVYALGSSLNEYGSRATTLYRVPNPRPVIEMLSKQFSNSPTLADYLAQRPAAASEGDGNA